MTAPLEAEDYRNLLVSALPPAQDADTVEPTLFNLFTPDSHRLALHVDTTVVRGGRGVGKTFWCRSCSTISCGMSPQRSTGSSGSGI